MFYTEALWNLFAAKKIAQTSPGVGTQTDMYLITTLGVEPIFRETVDKLDTLYLEYEARRASLGQSSITQIASYLNEIEREQKTISRSNEAPHGGTSETAAEAARKDEAQPQAASNDHKAA